MCESANQCNTVQPSQIIDKHSAFQISEEMKTMLQLAKDKHLWPVGDLMLKQII